MNQPPPELVRAAQAEDPRALEQLIDQSLPVVLRWCVRLSGPGIQAEDVAHDVFEILLDRLPTLKDPDAYTSWTYGITRRVLARHRRKAWLRRWIPGVEVEQADDALTPYDASAQHQTVTRVQDALQKLPLHHREVLVICDMEERTNTEAAAILGIPAPTVRSRLRRARASLRALVSEDEPAIALEVLEGGRR